MHGPINVKSPNNISEWQMGFNSTYKGLSHISISHITEDRTLTMWDGGFDIIPPNFDFRGYKN